MARSSLAGVSLASIDIIVTRSFLLEFQTGRVENRRPDGEGANERHRPSDTENQRFPFEIEGHTILATSLRAPSFPPPTRGTPPLFPFYRPPKSPRTSGLLCLHTKSSPVIATFSTRSSEIPGYLRSVCGAPISNRSVIIRDRSEIVHFSSASEPYEL